MFTEPYDGLIVGSLLTLTVSIITMVLTNLFSERQAKRRKQTEHEQTLLEQVYSPLYFYMNDLIRKMGTLSGFLLNAKDGEGLKNIDPKNFTEILKQLSKDIESQFLRKLLENKLGLIEPLEFQKDLMYSLIFLEQFELRLSTIKETEFEDIDLLDNKVSNYAKVSHYCYLTMAHLLKFLRMEVFSENAKINKFEYKGFLNINKFEEMSYLLANPEDRQSLEKVESMIKEMEEQTKDFAL
jgi:hypothetical protein